MMREREWTVSAWSSSVSAYVDRGGFGELDLYDTELVVGGDGYDGSSVRCSVPWDVVWWVMALNANAISEGLKALPDWRE